MLKLRELNDMPRTRCCARVSDEPRCRRFFTDQAGDESPIILQMEEMEAIRLKNYVGFDQIRAAEAMQISRPTFQRILQSARLKVATALMEGRSILISGGNYKMANRVFECLACHHVWEEAPCSEGGRHGYEIACPQCGKMEKMKIENGVRHQCGGHGHGGGCGCHHHG